MRSAFAVIAITLLSLSTCYLDESYTVDVLETVALTALNMHTSSFPEDHRFDSFRARIQDLPRTALVRQIERLARADSAAADFIERNLPGAAVLDTYNFDNLANIALFCNDLYNNGRSFLGSKQNMKDGSSLYVKIFITGISREELIVSILKLSANHNLTVKDYEDILSKADYTDVRTRLDREDLQSLIDADYAIQKFYFGRIVDNVDHLNKEEIMKHLENFLGIFPELEILGVLEKITKVEDN